MAFVSWVSSFLHSLVAFVIILIPLVVFHEFGHYIFARIFGVKAEVFSVGFGPILLRKQLGETEFRVSLIPLGGFVKLLGEDGEGELKPEDLKRALHQQAPWKRFFIFLGGPLFNFILAAFLFMVMLAIGEPQISSTIGRVVKGSAAEKAGFHSGDLILSVDGKSVNKYDEVFLVLNESPGKRLSFLVQRPGTPTPITIEAPVTSRLGSSIYGETTFVGDVDGLSASRSTQVGVSGPNSVAGLAGIKTGNRIVSADQKPMKSWEELETFYSGLAPGAQFKLVLTPTVEANPESGREISLSKPLHSENDLGKDLGLFSSELFVEKAVPKSPAESAGVKAGDRLVAINGQEVNSFFELKEAVQKAGATEGKVHLKMEREGIQSTLDIVPTATTGRDLVLNRAVQYTVGVQPMLIFAEPAMFVEQVWNPLKLIYLGTEKMITFSWRNLVSLRKMITGDVSVGNIGGPIMIGKIAGESLKRGFFAFLTNMAIFSIGLGILNILPVPVLDGGHLMLLGIETIRGKQLSLRQMEIVQGVGLVLILALMGIAFRNDLARLFYS